MDPFTEKLLERTRARRENLQKKMAERPNAANRLMVKRPLADTNSVITEPIVDKVPQVSSKPSPSKRRCSEENIQPAAGEKNQEPVMTRPSAPNASDPPTDKKPPVGPASIRSSSSLEKTATRPAVQSQPGQLRTAQPEPVKMVVTPAPEPPCSTEVETADVRKENLVEQQTPSAAGMKSRLQKLVVQRKCWEDDDTADALPDYTPLSVLKRQADVPPTQVHTTTAFSSETPVGRRGRLANLAATIGSWEDDLSHAHVPSAKDEPSKAVPKAAGRAAAAGSSAASGKLVSSQQAERSPVKSSRNFPPSLQKSDIPAARPAFNKPGSSPQKSSIHAAAFPSSPQKPEASSSVTVPQSPLKNQILSRGPNPSFSPQKPEPSSSVTVPQSPLKNQILSRGPNPSFSPQKPEICAKPTTVSIGAPQEKAVSGAPGVKSFLERFGERCQERATQNSPAGGITHIKTPSVTPSAVTPNSRVVQERFRAAQATNTTTADLTQRQKLERESELAQIRSRFQKGNNVWKHKEKEETNKITDIKEPLQKPFEAEAASVESQDEPSPPSAQSTDTPRKCPPPALGLMVSPPALTSSPLKTVVDAKDQMTDATPDEVEEQQEEVKEREMNVDESVNSAVINGLFDGILEQSEDQKDDDEEEEEDALNISSMSLLTPLAETVAAVVKSPERRMMTSTPASSFLIKSNTPESVTTANKLQRANMGQSASFDSVDASDEDLKLPYSIDAYRSTRVKEPERPSVKQVIVRNENVCQRAEEPRGSSLFSLKQKMKVLNGEMNLQQTVIHQASQALNCCTDEEHGKGSQVEAEAERLLLVATERREALMAELDRLKGELSGQKKTPAPLDFPNMSASKGSVTLQELRLPLKADFVCSTANRPEATKYSFFILIRAGAENTVATPLASTHCGLNGDTLTFPTKFTLSDVSSNFDIDIEVYGLVQKRDACSDKKKKPSKSKIMWRQVYEAHDLCMSAITPKRFLAITKTVQTPVVASPGGPNAVRTSNFILVGSHKLTLTSIGKNKFPLEKIRYEGELLSDMFHTKVPYLCPLEGHVYLKMQCEVGSKVEGRGFLTMFEDVSGFGAWHRRWCVLSGYCISYWTYPDDEKRKNPIGRINLANCTSKKVEPVNREFCARPNTLELITVRPQREDDKETLVTQCQNTMCVTKNWLSADTKDERNLWMNKLNQILVDLRMWKPDSCYRPQ